MAQIRQNRKKHDLLHLTANEAQNAVVRQANNNWFNPTSYLINQRWKNGNPGAERQGDQQAQDAEPIDQAEGYEEITQVSKGTTPWGAGWDRLFDSESEDSGDAPNSGRGTKTSPTGRQTQRMIGRARRRLASRTRTTARWAYLTLTRKTMGDSPQARYGTHETPLSQVGRPRASQTVAQTCRMYLSGTRLAPVSPTGVGALGRLQRPTPDTGLAFAGRPGGVHPGPG